MKPPKRAKDTLRDLGVRPTKQRGQNFIVDPSVIDQIVQFGAPNEEDTIVEIGPGLGALTKALSKFKDLTLIELEKNFCDELRSQYPHATVIESDVRTVDFSQIGDDLVVFGNIPYVFSTDIIFHLIQYAKSVRRVVLLLQKEFAERVAAPPGSRAYGRLSVATQLWADARLGPTIPGDVFHPPTAVESRLLELTFLPEPRYPIPDYKWFEKVVKAAFIQRRKKLANSLKSAGFFKADHIASALTRAGIDGGRRAETLSIEEYVRLSEALKLPQ